MQGGAAPFNPTPPAAPTTPQTFLQKIAAQYGPIIKQAKAGAAAAGTALMSAPVAAGAAGVGSALYSPSLNSGEDEDMRKIMEGYKLAKKHGLL